MTEFGIRLEFVNGWCRLNVASGGAERTFMATNLFDCFVDLVNSVGDVVDGRVLSSFLWPSEPGGWIVEFAQLGFKDVQMSVYEIADPNWLTSKPWQADRGALVLRISEARPVFMREFVAAIRELKPESGEDVIRTWGWPFPANRLLELEQKLRPWGYRPRDGWGRRAQDGGASQPT